MAWLAALWFAAALWALASGRAMWGRQVARRHEHPQQYWISVGLCLAIGVLLLWLSPVR
jgi:hypothetical protein